MTELSQPGELTGVAKSLGITRTSWGKGCSSYSLTITESLCNKGGVAFGGLHTVLLDMALGGVLVSLLPEKTWGDLCISYYCLGSSATANLRPSFSQLRCSDAATCLFMASFSRLRCRDAATANFLAAFS